MTIRSSSKTLVFYRHGPREPRPCHSPPQGGHDRTLTFCGRVVFLPTHSFSSDQLSSSMKWRISRNSFRLDVQGGQHYGKFRRCFWCRGELEAIIDMFGRMNTSEEDDDDDWSEYSSGQSIPRALSFYELTGTFGSLPTDVFETHSQKRKVFEK